MSNNRKLCVLLVLVTIFKTYSNAASDNENQGIVGQQDNTIVDVDEVEFEEYVTTRMIRDVSVEYDDNSVILTTTNDQPLHMPLKPTLKAKSLNEFILKHDPYKWNLSSKCNNFKHGIELDMNMMADIWEVVYYKLPYDIVCFRMLVKLNNLEEKETNFQQFGNYTDKVDWDNCHMEIKSSERFRNFSRKHLLQGPIQNMGIMDNIIIDEQNYNSGKSDVLIRKEPADQWMVVKNLLLMRDCETSDVVVFSRVPMKPRREDILDALMIFGEDKANGKMHCNNSYQW